MKRKRLRQTIKCNTKKCKRGRKKASVSTVKRMISKTEESKWSSFYSGSAPTSAVPTFFGMNQMGKGDDRNTRTANRIKMQHLYLRMFVQSAATVVAGQIVRAIIFIDKQANGAIPVFADLFSDPTIGNNWTSPFNPNTVGPRYKILRDKYFISDPAIATTTTPATGIVTTTSNQQKFHKFSVNLKMRTVDFSDANFGDQRDIIKNSLYLFICTDIGTAPACSVDWVFKFKDA